MPSNRVRQMYTYLDRLADDLRTFLRQSIRQWDDDAIHDARVTTRRLKAAIDLCENKLPAKVLRPFRKSLGKLRRRLGPLRDADIMLAHLDDPGLKSRYGDARNWLRRRLVEDRDGLRQKCTGRAWHAKWLKRLASWPALRDALASADVDWRAILSARLRSQWDEFRRRAEQVAASLAAGSQPDADAHGLRIAGKLLRYTLELAGELGFDIPRPLLRSFKAFQDALGSWHDFVILSQRIVAEASAPSLAFASPRVYEQLLSMGHVAWAHSRRELSRFARLWRKQDLVRPNFNSRSDPGR